MTLYDSYKTGKCIDISCYANAYFTLHLQHISLKPQPGFSTDGIPQPPFSAACNPE